MLQLWQKLPLFASVEIPPSGASAPDTKKVLMGQPAIDHMWNELKSTPEDAVRQSDIDSLGVWAWLLPSASQQQLHALSMKLLNARQATPAKRQLKVDADNKTSKKSKPKVVPDNHTALAFLGVK
eukprot:6476246-Amphidinium_carterae.2